MKHCPRCDEKMRWYPLPAGGGYWLCGHCGTIELVDVQVCKGGCHEAIGPRIAE